MERSAISREQFLYTLLGLKAESSPSAAVESLSTSPDALAALTALVNALGDEEADSALDDATDGGCGRWREQLPALADDWSAGLPLGDRYVALLDHLAICSDCRQDLSALHTFNNAELTAPGYHPFTPAASAPTAVPLWRRVEDGLYALTEGIRIVVDESSARFHRLPASLGLTQQRAAALRAEEEQESRTLVEVPFEQANMLVHLEIGTVHDHSGSLVLTVTHLTSRVPLSDLPVTLRDREDLLLEGAVTDRDGRVIFRDLDPEPYHFQIANGPHTCSIGVSLEPPDNGS